MLPAGEAGVARGVVHLIHRLRPGACGVGRGDVQHLPAIEAAISHQPVRFVRPVLAPVLDHDGLVLRAHQKQVLQGDVIALVLDHIDHFARRRDLGLLQFVAGLDRQVFGEIEGHRVLAGHGEDRLAVGLVLRPVVRRSRRGGWGRGHRRAPVRTGRTGGEGEAGRAGGEKEFQRRHHVPARRGRAGSVYQPQNNAEAPASGRTGERLLPIFILRTIHTCNLKTGGFICAANENQLQCWAGP